MADPAPSLVVQKRYIMRFAPKLSRAHQVTLVGLVQGHTGGDPDAMDQIPAGVAIFLDALEEDLVARLYHTVHAVIEQL